MLHFCCTFFATDKKISCLPITQTAYSKDFAGADIQIRTGDLILTKDALYRLSYISNRQQSDLIIISQLPSLVKRKNKKNEIFSRREGKNKNPHCCHYSGKASAFPSDRRSGGILCKRAALAFIYESEVL